MSIPVRAKQNGPSSTIFLKEKKEYMVSNLVLISIDCI